ncbi:hypothetical protein [Mesonia aestuariivivens]|uniref:DUF3168 domain-containing protein n=1 Tax=Mesonia aestuariivivens TaxID=2796128 RepID=A0ABS6W0A5_9FLAO|nr:hypothetical protein [Mesonia aestuariivivens]MBW2961283.1 hypothetical protein [Mesonia aestuariivivens]
MIVDYTEQFAENNLGYKFQYGAEHWQNLIDAEDDTSIPFEEKQKYLLFLWHDEEDKLNEHGATEALTYTGEFLLMVRSKLSDESQETKYKDAVRYLKGEASKVLEGYLNCDGYTVKRWKKIEVYDEFDTNMDGLKIQFTIEYIEQ